MTDKKLTLYAWEGNAAAVVYAVQGEHQSRSLVLTLIAARGGENSPWGAESVDKPLDLTGMATPRLYVEKPDGTQVVTDGEITDAKKGVVAFRLTAQQLASPGTAACQVVLTKSTGEVLKVVGMQLDIQRSDLDGAIESSDEYPILVTLIAQTRQAVDAANAAKDAANTAAGNANSKAQLANTAATTANAKAQAAQSAAAACNTATTAANTAKDAANTAAGNANSKAQLADTASTAATAKAQEAGTAAATAKKMIDTIYKAIDNDDLRGAPGGVGLGGCNMIAGGGTRYPQLTGYQLQMHTGCGTRPGGKYTVVVKAVLPDGQQIGVAPNGGSAPVLLLDETLPDIYTGVITVPANAAADAVGIYNCPEATAGQSSVDWVCMYKGAVDNPPTIWTPALEEVVNGDVANRNLIQRGWWFSGAFAGFTMRTEYGGRPCLKIPHREVYNAGAKENMFPLLQFEEKTQYTIRMDWTNDVTGTYEGQGARLLIHYTDGSETFSDSLASSTTPGTYCTDVFTTRAGKTVQNISFSYTTNGNTYIANYKLERGAQATYWTPAPEDVLDSRPISTRNLIRQSNITEWLPNRTGTGTAALKKDEKEPYYRITPDAGNPVSAHCTYKNKLTRGFTANTACTLGVDVRPSEDVWLTFYDASTGHRPEKLLKGGQWVRVYAPAVAGGSQAGQCTVSATAVTGQTQWVDVRLLKLTEGDTLSDWTSAPEDAQDVYSSGAWTPRLTGYSGAYTTASGNYARHKGLATVSAVLVLDPAYSASLASQPVQITGVPVPVGVKGLLQASVDTAATTSLLGALTAKIEGSTITLQVTTLAAKTANITWSQLVKEGISNHLELTLSGSYIAAE